MRVSPAKTLILIAVWLVILLEARTALGFFDVEVTVVEIVVVGVVTVAAFLVWSVWPTREADS